MKRLTVAFVGMGNVGLEVWKELENLRERWLVEHGVEFVVSGVATRRHGIVLGPDLHRRCWPNPGAQRASTPSTLEWLSRRPADILVELSTLDPRHGEPAIDHLRTALRAGMHIVTANKGPQAFAYEELMAEALGRKLAYRFESSVLDGMPVFTLPRTMPGCRVVAVKGIVNSTTNYILSSMEDGSSYAAALREAQNMGIAEANPAWDVEGWDAAFKIAILSNVLLGKRTSPHDVQRTGIETIGAAEIAEARNHGQRLRLVASSSLHSPASVRIERVSQSELYASIRGTSNVLTIEFDLFGPMSLVEPSPGLTQTAYGVLADLLSIAQGDLWAINPGSPPKAAC